MDVNAKRDNSRIKEIEIMDCTLRDGEQTNGVSFLPHEKLMIARMLLHDINAVSYTHLTLPTICSV